MDRPSRKKIPYAVDAPLHAYLRGYGRELDLPIEYETLRHFTESYPLTDETGKDTLWLTVVYPPSELPRIADGLRKTYSLLRVTGDVGDLDHLAVDRIDFAEFGNSQPFRVRIVNKINDNHDYYYVKKADASRVYGLELEHLLSPNRMHFIIKGDTLVEEHVLGIPGDIFITKHLRSPGFREVRIAKEFVKFNERCFIRLLGDMRSYNYVVDVTPDFEEVHYRIRPMDFDQQSYDGRPSFYRPQFFPDNNPLIEFGIRYMDVRSMKQYQREERAMILLRMRSEEYRLGHLLHAMKQQPLAPEEKICHLREGLAEYYKDSRFLACESMGAIVQHSLDLLREGKGGIHYTGIE